MAKNELVTPLGDSAMDETNDALKTTLATTIAGEGRLNASAFSSMRCANLANGTVG